MRGQILGSRVRGGFAGEVSITVNVPGGPSRTVTTVPASAPTTRPAASWRGCLDAIADPASGVRSPSSESR